jgi:hypothetical protein
VNTRTLVLIPLLCYLGCSDLGVSPWADWTEYDLPYAQIYLPHELAQVSSVAAHPENPDFAGVVGGHRYVVEFCIYTELWTSQFIDYSEQTVTLDGKPAALFRCQGFLHPYDSHLSRLIGLKAYFRPDGTPLMVVVAIQSLEAESLAREILFSLHPQPQNTGLVL